MKLKDRQRRPAGGLGSGMGRRWGLPGGGASGLLLPDHKCPASVAPPPPSPGPRYTLHDSPRREGAQGTRIRPHARIQGLEAAGHGVGGEDPRGGEPCMEWGAPADQTFPGRDRLPGISQEIQASGSPRHLNGRCVTAGKRSPSLSPLPANPRFQKQRHLAGACSPSPCQILLRGQVLGIRAPGAGQGPGPATPLRIPMGWAAGRCIPEGFCFFFYTCPSPFVSIPLFCLQIS